MVIRAYHLRTKYPRNWLFIAIEPAFMGDSVWVPDYWKGMGI